MSTERWEITCEYEDDDGDDYASNDDDNLDDISIAVGNAVLTNALTSD